MGNLYWLYFYLNLFHKNHFQPGVFACYAPPDPVLFFNVLLSLIGLIICVQIFRNKINLIKWLIINIGLFIMGVITVLIIDFLEFM